MNEPVMQGNSHHFATESSSPAPASVLDRAREAIHRAYRVDEGPLVAILAEAAALLPEQQARASRRALELAARVREKHRTSLSAESFLGRYGLASHEGVVLMCLAETLLRVPDKRTADELIRDKLGRLGWNEERSGEGPLLLNAPTWGLLLTGKLVSWRDELTDDPLSLIKNLIARAGEPVVRAAVRQAMQIMARQFVVGETISEALANVEAARGAGYTHSFDMLGEAARTRSDADDYFNAYADAIRELGNVARAGDPYQNPGISIKLSALHPRYEPQKAAQVLQELLPRLHELARSASSRNLSLTIDAEESDRLMLSLRLFEELAKAADLQGWTGLGLAVQAYQKRALHVIDWLRVLASFHGCRIGVRLVKGAYWDTEIKVAQQNGVSDYPVFTRKAATDVSYLACARRLLAARSGIYPQFATHNIATFAAILELAGDTSGFEFQKLYGMGDALYQDVMEEQPLGVRCRVYAPVGRYRELMPYLVRRILENGANSSFVHRISDPSVPLESLVADPIAMVATPYVRNPNVPPPPRLFVDRNNSTTLDLADEIVQEEVAAAVARARQAAPQPDTTQAPDQLRVVVEPCDTRRIVGSVSEAEDLLEEALSAAYGSADSWRLQAVDDRAVCLERAADLMEKRFRDLVVLCAREAGKTQPDAVAEVREAVDFCRYYAVRARRDLATVRLPGPTGEANALTYHGRGVFACISPWNFPLAIFTGQVSAALVAGNAVVAKPAEQTPLAASAAVAILHEAGVPGNVLRLVPGPGETTGARLVSDARIAGVVFTGSVETARAINAALAARPGPIIPFIAETGGQNAMIVDSSALPEQVVADVLTSAFQSAGQRCSSLRLLFLQQDIAPRVVKLLQGAMHELKLGDPALAGTDVGPVIDSEAKEHLLQYIGNLKRKGRLIAEAPLPHGLEHGHYVAPVAVEIGIEDIPSREVFGPVLHVMRFEAGKLADVVDAINGTGYGLTLGIQSRLDRLVDQVTERVGVGNTYVNRNMIGAVVGVQPFGGERLSGTGPKAGGPNYLQRFVVERTLTINTAAVGGNTALLASTEF